MMLLPPVVVARGWDPLHSSFFSLSFGGNGYVNQSYGLVDNMDMQAQLAVGKWLFKTMGIRLTFTELHATNAVHVQSFYESGEFDVIVSPLDLLHPRIQERSIYFYTYFGVGVVHRHNNAEQEMDNDFMGSVGIRVEQRLVGSFFLHGDLGVHIYPSDFDKNPLTSYVAMAMMGFTYKMRYRPFYLVSPGESQRMREDWYVGGALSGGMWPHPSLSRPTFSAGVDMIVGKHLSTVWEVRGRFSMYHNLASPSFQHYNANFDFMANVANVFVEQRNRRWNLSPYVGLGVMDNLKSKEKFLFDLSGGLYLRHWLTVKSDLYVDARLTAVPSRFSVAASPFYVTLSLGYAYNIGRNTCR